MRLQVVTLCGEGLYLGVCLCNISRSLLQVLIPLLYVSCQALNLRLLLSNTGLQLSQLVVQLLNTVTLAIDGLGVLFHVGQLVL